MDRPDCARRSESRFEKTAAARAVGNPEGLVASRAGSLLRNSLRSLLLF